VIAAYRPKLRNEWRTEWALVLLYRPLSMVLTPLFVAMSCPPIAITLFGLLIALVLPWLAVAGGQHAALLVGGLGIACCILDCMDGDVARVSGRTSQLGAYLDFVTDIVYRVAIYAALGLLVDAGMPGTMPDWLGANPGLAAGMLCALLALIARLCRLYAQSGDTRAGDSASLSAAQRLFAFLSGLDHLLPVAIIVCGLTGSLPGLLTALFVYSLADLLITQKTVLSRVG
jgi:phosphatidylglycerophosphate synthase